MKLITAEESRRIDRLSQEKFGVHSYSLMSRAGEAVALAVARRWPDALAQGVLVITGKGNNGGDGLVAARRLKQSGAKVSVALLARIAELKGDAGRAAHDFAAIGGKLDETSDDTAFRRALAGTPAVVVDAIFGTGLNAPVTGLAAHAIAHIDRVAAPVVAIDIASGINADTGEVMGSAVKAGLTVTFGLAKFGHFSYPGADYCGELEIADIGFPAKAIEETAPRGRWLERSEVAALLKPRPINSHKGMFGHPIIIAASRGKAGAALLAARGALRAGAGLVTAAVPESVAGIVAAGQAELMTEPMPDRDGHFDASESASRLERMLDGKTAIVAGPGIGVSEDSKRLVSWLVAESTRQAVPLVLDADGLNALAEIGCEVALKASAPVVLTPHPGEMGRLLKIGNAAVNANRIGAARRLALATNAFVLLKGARSVIASPDGTIYINSTGNPGMGTPGVGDALSGILGALLGQNMTPMDALALGVFAHGDAADRAANRVGTVGYIAGDIIDELPQALNSLRAEGVSR